MIGFIKKAFFTGLTILSTLMGANSLNCISIKNTECKVRPKIINVNNNESVFYHFSVKTSKAVVVVHQWSICKDLCSSCCKKFKY